MKYIAYVKQSGEGCDYTIGCGQTLFELDADDLESAMIELRGKVLELDGDEELESAVLYEVSQMRSMPVEEWYALEKMKIETAEKQRKEDVERKEFERLKNKFGQGAA